MPKSVTNSRNFQSIFFPLRYRYPLGTTQKADEIFCIHKAIGEDIPSAIYDGMVIVEAPPPDITERSVAIRAIKKIEINICIFNYIIYSPSRSIRTPPPRRTVLHHTYGPPTLR